MRRAPIPVHVKPLLEHIGQIASQGGMRAYIVGGGVRDWLMGHEETEDLDIVVEGNGIDLARIIGRTLGGAVEAHQQFGTAAVLLPASRQPSTHGRGVTGGVPAPRTVRVDVATARTETYPKPAAYPRVSPGTLKEDLARRDFTINAIAMAITPGQVGTLVDPFHGSRDIQGKVLRVLHPRSFLDDPSRMLRGVRFAQRFGLRWEPATAWAARQAIAAGALGWLNAGRLRKELNRLCDEPNPLACFAQLADLLDRVP